MTTLFSFSKCYFLSSTRQTKCYIIPVWNVLRFFLQIYRTHTPSKNVFCICIQKSTFEIKTDLPIRGYSKLRQFFKMCNKNCVNFFLFHFSLLLIFNKGHTPYSGISVVFVYSQSKRGFLDFMYIYIFIITHSY